MSEQPDPAVVAREARSIHQSLKELLKTKEPFDKEVDFQRKDLRRRYLILLLVHPNARESIDVENHLWMQTSYASIAAFKQRIAVHRAVQSNQRPQQESSGPPPKQNTHHGVVEHRKLLQRFKQFLSDEEKFWTQLILRLLRLFDLHEARAALIVLGLLDEPDEGTTSADADVDGNGRNHFQFPPRDLSLDSSPKTPEEREARISTLSKALICLGDIARYREQYNESNGRPRAGHDDNIPARRGRGRRGGAPETVARPRNYDKAQQCYEQARFLVPHEGNPSHQLAILASYQKDSFSSIIHYYRSLCVRQPYDTASENLGTVLMKSLDLWRQKMIREKKDKVGTNDAELPIKIRVDLLRERIVVLHALWRVGMEKGIEKMRLISPKHNEKVAQDFGFLVADRHLSIDMILNTVVLAQGALWKHRMIRDPTHHRNRSDSTSDSATLIEWSILDHFLDLYRILLDVGKKELVDPPEETDLGQKISAAFRRTLPALRIGSKWLRANFKYLGQDQEFLAFQMKEKFRNFTVSKRDPNKISGYSVKTIKFWKSYASFAFALSQAFPSQKLPPFEAPLEEDIEMRGFLPLRNLIGEMPKTGEKTPASGQVHPNVEQLMRISDLLDDAKSLLNVENAPLLLVKNHFIFNLEMVEDSSSSSSSPQVVEEATEIQQDQPLTNVIESSLEKHDHEADDMIDLTSRMDDDPVRDAFQFLNAASDPVEDEDEEDEIVYMRSPTLSPNHQAPITPVRPAHSPENRSPQSPTLHHGDKVSPLKPSMPVPQTTTTAQDLLNDVMGMGGLSNHRRGLSAIIQGSSSLQPKFLFGSELSRGPSQSIWSAARDEQPLIYAGNSTITTSTGFNGHHSGVNGSHNIIGGANFQNGLHPDFQTTSPSGQVYHAPSHSFSSSGDSHDFPGQPSIWSASYGAPPTSPRRAVPFSASTFSQSPQAPLSTAIPQFPLHPPHRREQSASGISRQLYPNHPQLEPFTYPSSGLQQPVHHPDSQSSAHFSPSVGHGGLQPYGQSTTATSISTEAGQPFFNRTPFGYHSRQVSNQNSPPEMGHFVSPTVSQNWDNGGLGS